MQVPRCIADIDYVVAGVCAYIFCVAMPLHFTWDIPLIVLTEVAIVAFVTVYFHGPRVSARSSIDVAIVVFLAATLCSILVSREMHWSVSLSRFLIPATLLYFLIARQFLGLRSIEQLYSALALLGAGLSVALLWSAWQQGGADRNVWTTGAGSPLLIVANDTTMLAVMAPLLVALLAISETRFTRLVAGASLFLSVLVVTAYQSRTASLVIILSVAAMCAALRSRIAAICLCCIIAEGLAVDGVLGFGLLEKFARNSTQDRLALWQAALGMFRDAPVLGHGPQTFVFHYKEYLPPGGPLHPALIVPWSHNIYLDTLAQQGIAGIAALGYLLFQGFREGFVFRRIEGGSRQFLTAGAFFGLFAVCLAGTIELTFLRPWLTILLFVLLGVIAQLSITRIRSAPE